MSISELDLICWRRNLGFQRQCLWTYYLAALTQWVAVFCCWFTGPATWTLWYSLPWIACLTRNQPRLPDTRVHPSFELLFHNSRTIWQSHQPGAQCSSWLGLDHSKFQALECAFSGLFSADNWRIGASFACNSAGSLSRDAQAVLDWFGPSSLGWREMVWCLQEIAARELSLSTQAPPCTQ